VPKGYFGACLNRIIIDRMRKTRWHCVVPAYVVAWCGDPAWMKNFVFFFTWKEASFGFRKMTRQWMSTFSVSSNIAAWNVVSSRTMKIVVVVKCWLVVPQRYRNLGFCSLTLLFNLLGRINDSEHSGGGLKPKQGPQLCRPLTLFIALHVAWFLVLTCADTGRRTDPIA